MTRFRSPDPDRSAAVGPVQSGDMDVAGSNLDVNADAHVTEALDLMAHELRNATSTLWTGLRLMSDADPNETDEIARDLRSPADVLLLMVDLAVEAARASRRTSSREAVTIGDVVDRAAKRARRSGVVIDGSVSEVRVLAVAGSIERCLCAAAVATGSTHLTVRSGGPTELEFVPNDTSALHERIVEAGALLGQGLAAESGVTWSVEETSPTRCVRLTFAAAD